MADHSMIGVHSDKKAPKKLSELGHFLKGSSAALGVSKVQETCEKIQHYGELRDEEKKTDITAEQALDLIGELLKGVKGDFQVAKTWLLDWFKKNKWAPAIEFES
jgi:osomolarity two-component system, phosphorelay intermediate protein YPD1